MIKLFRLIYKKQFLILFVLFLFAFSLGIFGLFWGISTTYHPDERAILDKVADMMNRNTTDPYLFRPYIAYPSLWVHVVYFVRSFLFYFDLEQNTILFLRIINLTLSSMTAVLIYFIGKNVHTKTTGVVASMLFSVTALRIRDSHFMTTDIPFLFFTLLSIYFATNIIKSNKKRDYLLSGLFVGFASAIRYNGPLLFILILLAHFIKNGIKFHKQLLASLLFVFIGLFISAPYTLYYTYLFFADVVSPTVYTDFDYARAGLWKREIYFLNFLPSELVLKLYKSIHANGYLNDLSSIIIKVGSDRLGFENTLPTPLYHLFVSLPYATGFPLLVFLFVAVLFSILRYKNKLILFVLISILILFTISSTWQIKYVRYLHPLLPLLAIVSGFFVTRMYTSKKYRIPVLVVLFAVVILSLQYAMPFSLQYLQTDTRELATIWIEKNLPSNSKILTDGMFAFIEPKGFDVSEDLVKYIRNVDSYNFLNNFDYLIVTSYFRDLYLRAPTQYQNQIIFFNYLEKNQTLVKLFVGRDGFFVENEYLPSPEVLIYKISS